MALCPQFWQSAKKELNLRIIIRTTHLRIIKKLLFLFYTEWKGENFILSLDEFH